jgi:hypothetical protein
LCADEPDLHLAHEHVYVVARVADQRDSFLIARKVSVVLEQLCGIVATVEIRRAGRAATVQRLEVRARGAHVAQGFEIAVSA